MTTTRRTTESVWFGFAMSSVTKVACFGQQQRQWQENAPKPQKVGQIEGFLCREQRYALKDKETLEHNQTKTK
ncbi:hypothetical protein M5D96_004008 [Drosophila gunungcola]|uniref:Uncharacterized protein n=1 Tax=Drosophila gunungcola TaxID=103775 RepID=A0A9P9YTB2_9MUSC|nr:hypothetical protein M5D96_004008 [Drosophila gunungcola]